MKKTILIAVAAAFALSAAAQFSKPRRDYVEWLVTSDRQDRTYQTGQKATVTVEAYKGGNALDGVTLYYKTGDEMFLPEGKGDSTVFRNGKATIDMGTRTEPGFKACDLRFTVYGKTYKGHGETRLRPCLHTLVFARSEGLRQLLEEDNQGGWQGGTGSRSDPDAAVLDRQGGGFARETDRRV